MTPHEESTAAPPPPVAADGVWARVIDRAHVGQNDLQKDLVNRAVDELVAGRRHQQRLDWARLAAQVASPILASIVAVIVCLIAYGAAQAGEYDEVRSVLLIGGGIVTTVAGAGAVGSFVARKRKP